MGGSLPPGITLIPDGTFSGTATTVGRYDVLISVCDQNRTCDTTGLLIGVGIPATGATTGPLAALGLLLLAAGLLLATASRGLRARRILIPAGLLTQPA